MPSRTPQIAAPLYLRPCLRCGGVRSLCTKEMNERTSKLHSRQGAKPRQSKPERHRWLDQWLVARGEPLRHLVQTSLRFLDHDETHRGLRRRLRRSVDLANYRRSVEIAVCNLAHAVLMPPPTGRLAVKLGSQRAGMTRYENLALGPKPFRSLIWRLDGLDFLSLHQSTRRGEVSSIAPTEWFAGKVREHGVSLADFGRDSSEEVILLHRNTHIVSENDERSVDRERIDYRDTNETRAYRAELQRLNSFLAAADIAFIDDGLAPVIDPFSRRMRRHFVVREDQGHRFDQGGRLFGGFWLELKRDRRPNIRINGEPVADLDFSGMFTRLAYARLGLLPPDGDPYAIDGAVNHRRGIKLAMNTFLFDTHNRRSKWPKEMGVAVDSDTHDSAFDARLPAGWTVGRTRKAILKRHPALAQVWGRGLGYQLMFDESRILLSALNGLMAENIPALGMHDGLLVQRSKKDIALTIMAQAARQIAGVDILVEEKGWSLTGLIDGRKGEERDR